MFKFVEKIEDKALDVMAAHPKLTRGIVAGSTAIATIGGSAVVASAEGEEPAAASADVVDTIVSKMGTELSGVAEKVIPAAVGVGIVFVAASLAWRWFKRMAYN